MTPRAPITVDGNLVGYLSLSWSEEIPIGEGLPPAVGLGAVKTGPGAAREQGPTFRSGIGPGHRQRIAEADRGPTFRHNIGPGHRQREQDQPPHVVPHRERPDRIPTGTYEHKDGEHKGPTLRPGLTPRGSADPEKPQHFTTADVKSAVEQIPGGIDRQSIAKELAGNEGLQRRYAQMVKGEVMGNASTHARVVQAETAANRALKRGHSLEQALWDTAGHGQAGYYPRKTFTREPITDEEFAAFKRDVLPQVLAGSDFAKGFTGNASADIAARQKARGAPYMDLRREGGDQYFDEDRGKTLPRLSGKPVGVTRLGPRSAPKATPKSEPAAANDGKSTSMPSGAMLAATGKPPEAFIMHHTGGGGTPAGVQNTLRQRGLGVEYIMDREGNIIRAGGPGSAHILPGWGKGAGLTNQNVVGMEVIAKDNKDVTPKQIESAKRFIRENYPETPVLGHGLVNPGHKEADEGKAITDAINAERAAQTK